MQQTKLGIIHMLLNDHTKNMHYIEQCSSCKNIINNPSNAFSYMYLEVQKNEEIVTSNSEDAKM